MIHKRLSILATAIAASAGLSAAAIADEGIRATGPDSGVIYFQDNGYTGSWNYLCIEIDGTDMCDAGTLENGYWQRPVTGLVDGTTYQIEAKIQDAATGQFLSGDIPAVFSAEGDTPPSDQPADSNTGPVQATSDYVYIVHKATGKKASSCGAIGTKVQMAEANATNACTQWEVVEANGKFFYLRSVQSDGYIRPRGLSNGIPVMVQPTSWTGNYMQWSTEDTGDGYFYLVNRQTKKYAYSTGDAFLQESKNWKGDWTRWQFEPVTGAVVTDTDTDTASVTDTDTDTDTGSTTDTDTGSATDTGTVTVTVTDTDTDTSMCGGPTLPDVDPAADLGEGYEAGLTTDGIAYYREKASPGRGFAIWGLQGSAPNVSGQEIVFTESNGTTYYRYEVDLGDVVEGQAYNLEMRLQGNEFGGGQCIHAFSVTPGEGLKDAQCYSPASAGGSGDPAPTPPAPPQAVGMKIIDATSGQARLVGGVAFEDKAGYALYTFADDRANQSNCSGSCEDNWPKVIVASPEAAVGAGGLSGNFGTITRVRNIVDQCGDSTEVTDYQLTYNDMPLYFFAGDNSASSTAGDNINGWNLATAELIPQLPLVDYPHKALKSTVNGLTPKSMGYAIDIEGRNLTWRPSASNNMQYGLITQFSPWGGNGYPRSAKDPNLQLWCSNNQIQFHHVDMPGTLAGPYTAEFPASCYGKFYYFLRYRIYGKVNNQPEDNWVYTALYEYDETNPNDRIDPRTRPTVKYTSANWQRIGHPHARDRVEEAVLFDAMPYNSTRVSGLERYTTDFVDGPNEFLIQPNATIAPMRIEAFEWGAGNCQGPQYVVNAGNPMQSGMFDYGQIISWEATFGTSNNAKFGGTAISSQVYNTMQNTTVGLGFSSATGDPRLNPVDQYGVRMVHSDGCNPVEKEERNARFAQHLTSIQSDVMVNDWLIGHDVTHALPQHSGARTLDTGYLGSVSVTSTTGVELSGENMGSCGTCHFRDGRSEFAFNTPKGVLIGPAIYGTGLLVEIKDRDPDVSLTWDGTQPTVASQSEAALWNDLRLKPEQVILTSEAEKDTNSPSANQTRFDQIVEYVRLLHVPVRDYDTYVDPEVAEGQVAFMEAGCGTECHKVTQKTRSVAEGAPIELADIVIRPYTDMKLHDIGTGKGHLGIGFRTPPLWGIGQNIELLERNGMNTIFQHDGRATSLEEAINNHAGEAIEEKEKLINMGKLPQVVKFLKSL